MDERNPSGSRPIESILRLVLLVGIATAATTSLAQVVDENVNVTAIAATGYNNSQLARQENEPSCGKNPLNELNILCAYNWYGFSDLPQQGDAWIGFSETVDGHHFIRRPLTGTKQNYSLGYKTNKRPFASRPAAMECS